MGKKHELDLSFGEIPTAKQRREFYEFALAIYTGKITIVNDEGYDLNDYGFCAIATYYIRSFSTLEQLPELFKHKPELFYTYDGDETSSKSQFWFRCGQNKERIEILEKILASDF